MKPPGKTVLLVDDSIFLRRLLSRVLGKNPRVEKLYEASDAAEGYSLFKICRPDIVVLDLELPDKHGLEVLSLIKNADPSCPVIIFTSIGAPEVREECLRRGADYFLTKDPGLLTVSKAITEVCKRGRKRNRSRKNPKQRTNVKISDLQ